MKTTAIWNRMLLIVLLCCISLCGCVKSKMMDDYKFTTQQDKAAAVETYIKGEREDNAQPKTIAVVSFVDHLKFTETNVFFGIPYLGLAEAALDSMSTISEQSFTPENTQPYLQKEYDLFIQQFTSKAGLQVMPLAAVMAYSQYKNLDYEGESDKESWLFGEGKTVVIDGTKFIHPPTGNKTEASAITLCQALNVDAVLLTQLNTRVVKKGKGNATVTLLSALDVKFRPEAHAKLWMYGKDGSLIWSAKSKTGVSKRDLEAHPGGFDVLYAEVEGPYTMLAEMMALHYKASSK